MNPAITDHIKTTAAPFTIPAKASQLPDGRWLLTPAPPIVRCRTAEATQITGLPSKTLHRLADCGLIRRAYLTTNIVLWWPADVEALIQRVTEDPAYARKVRHAADLSPQDLPPA